MENQRGRAGVDLHADSYRVSHAIQQTGTVKSKSGAIRQDVEL